MMYELVAAKGLGDAIYLRALALHLLERGKVVTVFTRWPDVFADMPVKIEADRTGYEDIRHCAYCLHCRLPEVRVETMFGMACRQAGVSEPVALRLGWAPRSRPPRRLKGRLLVYQPPKVVNGVEQGLLQPDRAAFRRYITSRTDCIRVKVGAELGEHGDMPAEVDLVDQTTIPELFDLASAADEFFGEPCALITIAQALDKPAVCMFSAKAKDAKQARVRNLTPARFFHKPELATAIYDAEVACGS